MMSLPFSTCPYITGFTRETGAEEWTTDTRDFSSQNDLLIYHESAEAFYTIGETIIHGVPGSVLMLPEGVSAKIDVKKSGSVIRIGFSVQKESAFVRTVALVATAAPSLLRNRFLHFAALHANTPSVGSECAMLAEFYGILYELQRNTSAGNRQSLLEDKIRPSVAYLETHFADQKLNIRQIAALSGISETYFRTLFLEQFGCTPLQYVIEKRVRAAEKLLTETDLSLREIEQSCGFQSHSYFLKQFQKFTQKSPEQVRAKSL